MQARGGHRRGRWHRLPRSWPASGRCEEPDQRTRSGPSGLSESSGSSSGAALRGLGPVTLRRQQRLHAASTDPRQPPQAGSQCRCLRMHRGVRGATTARARTHARRRGAPTPPPPPPARQAVRTPHTAALTQGVNGGSDPSLLTRGAPAPRRGSTRAASPRSGTCSRRRCRAVRRAGPPTTRAPC